MNLFIVIMPIIHNYCITNKYFQFLDDLNINVILAGSSFKNLKEYPKNWIKDNQGINISNKNKNFGSLSSHFWIWKNVFQNLSKDDWIGVSHYRRHWIKDINENINLHNLSDHILREIPKDYTYDVLLPKKIIMENLKLSKLIKKGIRNYIKKPSLLFNRKKISIELHLIYSMVINYYRDSIELINKEDKIDFKNYIKNENSFHQFQMYIAKKKIIEPLYVKVFEWVFKCEKNLVI